jgi:NitT/TauT family transport system permease protein
MTSAARCRLAVVLGSVLLLELLCRARAIDHLTMPPPSEILRDLGRMLSAGTLYPAIAKTLLNVVIAFSLAIVAGVAIGVALHGWQALRQGLDPLFATYYAIPVFAFYPLLTSCSGSATRRRS